MSEFTRVVIMEAAQWLEKRSVLFTAMWDAPNETIADPARKAHRDHVDTCKHWTRRKATEAETPMSRESNDIAVCEWCGERLENV